MAKQEESGVNSCTLPPNFTHTSSTPTNPIHLSLQFNPIKPQQGLAGDEIRHPGKTAALMCGMKGMTSLSQHILEEKGVAPTRILLNF